MDQHKDPRIVVGARCTWWDSIDKIGRLHTGRVSNGREITLPCCPHCKSVLYEYPNESVWFLGVDAFDRTNPGYRKMIEWGRGNCFPSFQDAQKAYNEAGRP